MHASSHDFYPRGRRFLTYGLALGVLALLATGWVRPPRTSLSVLLTLMGSFLLWFGIESAHAWSQYQRYEQGLPVPSNVWNGLGLVLLAGLAILLRLSGGLQSPFYPILYLCIAFLSSVGTSGQSTLWFVYALLLEVAALLSIGVPSHALGAAGLHILFLTVFAAAHQFFLNGLLWSVGEMERPQSFPPPTLENLTSLSSESTDSLSSSHASFEPEPLTAYSMEAMQPDQKMLLALLKEGLNAYSCAFLWLSREGTQYEIAAIESDEYNIDPGPFAVQVGAPAGLFKSKSKLRISNKTSPILLPYYQRRMDIRSMLAVPVRQGGQIRGALIADRLKDEPFSLQEEVLLEAAAVILGSAIDSERSLWNNQNPHQMVQSATSEPFWHQLNDFHSPALFGRQILTAAMQLVEYDMGFVSLCNETASHHTVLVASDYWRELEGVTFEVGESLLALSFKHGCPLPGRGQLRSEGSHQGPYISSIDPPELEDVHSLLLLPLKIQGRVIGSVILASRTPQSFSDSPGSTVWSMFSQYVAALMHNIQLRQGIQRARHIDALTGLDNHRSFLNKLESKVESAHRYQRKLSLLRLDIDNFGLLNQQFGTRAGDQVLEQLAQRLSALTHDVDLLARFGGDEFVLLLDNTSPYQALQTADSLRSELSRQAFVPDHDDPTIVFSVTLSIGVATYPDQALDPYRLLELSQEALEKARHLGGNNAMLHTSSEHGESLPQRSLEERLLATPRRGCGWGSLPPVNHSHDSDPFRTPWLSSSDSSGREPALQTPRPVEGSLQPLDDVLPNYPILSPDDDLH